MVKQNKKNEPNKKGIIPSNQKINNTEFNVFIKKKIDQVIDIIQRTYVSLEYCKQYDIFSKSSIGQCTDHLHTIFESSYKLKESIPIQEKEMNNTLNIIQTIFDKLSVIFSTYGTNNIKDIYYVVFGTKYNSIDTYDENNKYVTKKIELIEKYLIPVGYKNLPWKESDNNDDLVNKITDYTIQVDKSCHMECFEPSTMYYSLHQSVYGIRIIIRNTSEKKILCVNGLMKDIPLQYLLNNDYINTRIQEITLFLTENNIDDQEIIEKMDRYNYY